ncbi:MAG: response regulator [Lachnospiraceae bacterium]|nr:response regulator [Lachnospiraceae bacterium]
MNQKRTENFILLLITLACAGLTIESIMLGWEFWVPPLIIIGTILLWVMNVLSIPDYPIRRVGYLIYAMLTVFFHGVHETSIFDVVAIVTLVMIGFSFFDQVYMMHLFVAEYVIIMCMQIMMAHGSGSIVFDGLNISRVILHFSVIFLIYFSCVKAISDRAEYNDSIQDMNVRIDRNEADMEDFLSNISHELRTPINVVNGMSDLLINEGVGSEANSIKKAGIRLACQVEDIQDYTECKRQKVFLEEDNYMCISLINDVVTSFRQYDNTKNLEMVVDLSPQTPTMLRGDIKKLHKIFRHLLENAIKFTRKGGVYVKMFAESTDYGVNLCIEMTDTGMGMSRNDIRSISEGMYQANKKRNRSSGGIGLGLYIVHGFAHRMGGFVKIESERGNGTTIRVTIPQKIIDKKPCLSLAESFEGAVLFHVRPDKYKTPRLREFYRNMAANLATGIKVPLYPADTVYEVERLKEKISATHVFMGQEEYEENKGYFEELAKEDIIVVVSAEAGFELPEGSRVILMPKPLYAYPIIKILNEGRNVTDIEDDESRERPVFRGVKALIVDDEPMNLVVATSLFKNYEMVIDTAGSGKESIRKYRDNDYDIVFMDHMMPEMDGVEAMQKIKAVAADMDKKAVVVALTANAVSGAREMFINEGFDGFIAKPINITDFERVMLRVLPEANVKGGGRA